MMNRLKINKSALRYLLALLVLVILLAAWLILRPSPTQAIEKVVEKACRAAEAKSVVRLGFLFSDEFRDDRGIDKSTWLQQAQRFFTQTEDLKVDVIKIIHEDPALSASAGQARLLAILRISGVDRMSGSRFQGIGGKGSDAFLITVIRKRGAWQFIHAQRLDGRSPDELMRELHRE